ncbi:hypothetical protein Ancab_010508 [Ancistrocladus abbreviatus]
MKRWSGGMLIVILSSILVIRYTIVGTQKEKQPEKQSAYEFFRGPPTNDFQLNNLDSLKSSQRRVSSVKSKGKRPQLVDVDGLRDLYISTNLSADEAKSFLLWAQMRVVLSRPDPLPEMAKGVKEASIAWKELLSMVKSGNGSMIDGENKDILEGRNCSFSVAAFDIKNLPSSQRILELPCGLLEDSSITVIGIPHEHNGSFQIELVGSELQQEQKLPTILHYRVYLPGENTTEEPFVIQNTWTKDVGWGKEERCPAGRSANVTIVDGLPSCSEQVVRSAAENLNMSHSTGDSFTNISMEHTHVSGNFPFVEGSPFTATLWVGLEGLHMTVNGRHETSFKYRENLEPWWGSGVKVSGGVTLFSAIAKGLPVSEDLDLVDAEQLKAPPILKKRLVLLVGVFSTGNNFQRRMALRRSWMQYYAVRSGEVAVRFIIGFHKNTAVNVELWKEALSYGDIQLMPFLDYYSLISLKTIAICAMGTKILPAKYIMKTDDDAFVRIDELLSNLKGKPSGGLLYGLISFQSSPHRDESNKWYVSHEEWPHEIYPPWAHGPGYIISRDIAKFVAQGHQEKELKLFKLEDVAMGIWIEQFKKNGHEVHYVSDDHFHNEGCESDYILAHYQNPRKVLCLWEKLQKEHQPICCE